MTPLRVLTIDDEPLALRRLKLLLQTVPQATFVGEASSCADALTSIETLRPDVILLDIKMRDGTGFDVVEALRKQSRPPAVVFVTAFDHFAVRAFDSTIADYLLKPVAKDRLVRALCRAQQQIESADAAQRMDEMQLIVRQLRAACHNDTTPPFESEFWLRGPGGLVRVPVDTIDCVSSEDDYVNIHTQGGSHLMRASIRQFVDRVEPGIFVRVHRRWLVRLSSITELSMPRAGRPAIVLNNGRRLPAGRVYFKDLRRAVLGQTAAEK